MEEIWNIAADNIVATDALIDKLVEKSASLAANAELGRARPELHEGLRSFPVGNCILFCEMCWTGLLCPERVHHMAKKMRDSYIEHLRSLRTQTRRGRESCRN